jgi:hypothetical protein
LKNNIKSRIKRGKAMATAHSVYTRKLQDYIDIKRRNLLSTRPDLSPEEIVGELMKAGGVNHGPVTPLMLACKLNCPEIVAELTKMEGIDLDKQDRAGNTALHYAAVHNNKAVYKPLLLRGANPTLRNIKHETPLIVASEHYFRPDTQAYGFSVLMTYSKGIRDPLGTDGHLEATGWGNVIDAVNEHGETALMRAAFHGNRYPTQVLLENGASHSLRRPEDRSTALMLASDMSNARVGQVSSFRKLECVGLLLRHGADLHAARNDGNTPLRTLTHLSMPKLGEAILFVAKADRAVAEQKAGIMEKLLHDSDSPASPHTTGLRALIRPGADGTPPILPADRAIYTELRAKVPDIRERMSELGVEGKSFANRILLERMQAVHGTSIC